MDNSVFYATNEKNERVKCNIIFTFDSDETNKSYVVFTDNTFDEEGRMRVSAATYKPNKYEEIDEIFPIETEKEWQTINYLIEEFKEMVRDGEV